MLKLLLLGTLSAWTAIAQAPVSVLVVDDNGTPLGGVWVEGISAPRLQAVTSPAGRIESTAVSPRIAFRKTGYQTAIIPPQTGLTLTLRPAARSPIPRCSGPTSRATRFHLPKAKKPSKQTDIDYECKFYTVQTKTGKQVVRHCAGPMWSFGAPISSRLSTSTEYSEDSYLGDGANITLARGRSKEGATWRFLGVFGETIEYQTTDAEAIPQLDAIFNSACLSAP